MAYDNVIMGCRQYMTFSVTVLSWSTKLIQYTKVVRTSISRTITAFLQVFVSIARSQGFHDVSVKLGRSNKQSLLMVFSR